MQHFNETLDALILRWDSDGARPNKGASESAITMLEDELTFNFEEDFKTYLFKANGFEDFASDEHFFSFWSTDRIRGEASDNHPSELICFVDYTISLCSYGFDRETGKVYTHFQHDNKLYFIADNFKEFMQIYLNDWQDLMR